MLGLQKLQGGVPQEAHDQLRKRMAFASKRKQIRMLTELDQKNTQIYRRLKEIENVHQTRRKLKKQLSNARVSHVSQQRHIKVALRNELSGEDSLTNSPSASPRRGAAYRHDPAADQAMQIQENVELRKSQGAMAFEKGNIVREYTDRAIMMKQKLPQIQAGAPIKHDLAREKVKSTTTMNSVRLGTGDVRSASQLLLMKERHPLLAHEEEKVTLA